MSEPGVCPTCGLPEPYECAMSDVPHPPTTAEQTRQLTLGADQ